MSENDLVSSTSETKQPDRQCRLTTKHLRNLHVLSSSPSLHTLCASFRSICYKTVTFFPLSNSHFNCSQDLDLGRLCILSASDQPTRHQEKFVYCIEPPSIKIPCGRLALRNRHSARQQRIYRKERTLRSKESFLCLLCREAKSST